MAEHHLPPEPVVVGRPTKGVHAGDLKPRGRRYGYSNYYYGGGGGLRSLVFAILVLLLIIGIIWLVLYIVYRPSDPTLAVTSAAVLALYNATTTGPTTFATTGPTTTTSAGPTLLAASFQFTLVLRNPSARSTVRYDRLTAYAAYRGEPLTPPATLPPLTQDAGTAVSVSPVLGGGGAVPVSNDAAAALAADVGYGVVPMRVVLLGRVKFLSAPFHGRWHSLYGRCDMLVGVRNNQQGGGGVAQAPLLGNPDCDVDT
ncbi:hypothetical protein QOZ80_5AG0376000 [Eleusine coracana subsp. coracana]|nr:hypothetical protein QOZ80_5AG0376000 [Eleusine coracana subsp. coracana]